MKDSVNQIKGMKVGILLKDHGERFYARTKPVRIIPEYRDTENTKIQRKQILQAYDTFQNEIHNLYNQQYLGTLFGMLFSNKKKYYIHRNKLNVRSSKQVCPTLTPIASNLSTKSNVLRWKESDHEEKNSTRNNQNRKCKAQSLDFMLKDPFDFDVNYLLNYEVKNYSKTVEKYQQLPVSDKRNYHFENYIKTYSGNMFNSDNLKEIHDRKLNYDFKMSDKVHRSSLGIRKYKRIFKDIDIKMDLIHRNCKNSFLYSTRRIGCINNK